MKYIFGIIIGVSTVFAVLADFSWPSFHHAPGMTIDWQADRMVYNGLPMKVETFKCECSEESLLEYYRTRWDRENKQIIENDLGAYKQIGFADRKYFYAVMVKPDSLDFEHSVGRITISEIPTAKHKAYVMGGGVPQVGETQIINDVHDAMPGRRSRTVLMNNSRSVSQNVEYYRKYYKKKGWKSYLRPINSEIGSQAISYSQDNKDVNIVIHSRDGKTQVLFNEVTEVR